MFKPYYSRRIEGDRSEGSKAYLTCLNGWKLEQGTPAVQTCVRENGALVWSTAGTCVYSKFSVRGREGGGRGREGGGRERERGGGREGGRERVGERERERGS